MRIVGKFRPRAALWDVNDGIAALHSGVLAWRRHMSRLPDGILDSGNRQPAIGQALDRPRQVKFPDPHPTKLRTGTLTQNRRTGLPPTGSGSRRSHGPRSPGNGPVRIDGPHLGSLTEDVRLI